MVFSCESDICSHVNSGVVILVCSVLVIVLYDFEMTCFVWCAIC